MASRFVLPFADVGNGISPSDGAKLFFFDTGTVTEKDTFSDEALAIANANPVVADGKGLFPDIFLPNGSRYKIILKDKNGAQKFEADPILGVITAATIIQIFDTVSDMVASDLIENANAETSGYFDNGGKGAAKYFVSTAANYGRSAVTHADHVLENGLIAFLVPDNFASILAEQCGVSYGGMGVIETAQLQASVDVGIAIKNTYADTDSSWQVEINGYIRIDSTIVNAERTTFKGISAVRSRIIWSGGLTVGHMIDFGASSWGGLKNIRMVGFDSAAGQTALGDGIEHLLRYTFIDFFHTMNDVHFFTGYSDAIILEVGAGENAITNFNLTNIFFSNFGSGYLIKVLASLGGKRVINIVGLTAGNTESNAGGLIDTSSVTGGFAINVLGARIEYQTEIDTSDFALFNIGSTSTAASGRTTINLNNFTGFLTGAQGKFPIVRAVAENTVIISESACNFSSCHLLQYDDGTIPCPTDADRANSVIGSKVSQNVIGRTSIIAGNFADRLSDQPKALVKRGDFVLCNDGVCDYIVPDITDTDDHFYSYVSTGFSNAGKIASISSGSAVAALDSGAVEILRPGLAVQIAGAGVAAGNLDTFVLDIDITAFTVTFEDTASTTVSVSTSIIIRDAGWIQGFLKSRATTPADLSANSEGQSVYLEDLDVLQTWSGDRWMFDSNHHITTANRPVYSINSKYIGRSVYDTSLQKPVWWNGTVWKDAAGTTV